MPHPSNKKRQRRPSTPVKLILIGLYLAMATIIGFEIAGIINEIGDSQELEDLSSLLVGAGSLLLVSAAFSLIELAHGWRRRPRMETTVSIAPAQSAGTILPGVLSSETDSKVVRSTTYLWYNGPQLTLLQTASDRQYLVQLTEDIFHEDPTGKTEGKWEETYLVVEISEERRIALENVLIDIHSCFRFPEENMKLKQVLIQEDSELGEVRITSIIKPSTIDPKDLPTMGYGLESGGRNDTLLADTIHRYVSAGHAPPE